LPGSYDPWTILGSFLIACFAGYVAFESIDHTQFSNKPKQWAALGGCALGLGIWSMHFVGMTAWQPAYPLFYSVGRTLLSVFIAIVASVFAMLRVVRNQQSGKSSYNLIEAVLVGSGICAMHYIGMSALQFDKGEMWRSGWVITSLIIAIAASWAAMFLLERSRTDVASLNRRLLASIAIALAICGMHYAGMEAFMPAAGSICIHQPFSFSGAVLARIGVGNALFFTIVLLLASFREKNVWIEMVSRSHLETMDTARRLESMAVVEKIAASVAQEISNPLEAAITHLQQINATEISASGLIHLDAAQQDIRRIADVASHTLKFFSQQSGLNAASVPDIFESVIALFQAPLRTANIDFQTVFPENLPTILCHEHEIQQVIANLVSNAIDVMPEGGTLRLGVRPESDGLTIAVADTGRVIPAILRDRILKPLFSTQDLKGRGLGLAVISETIRRNGGTSTFVSPAPGLDVGTEFRFFLPSAYSKT
jgi:NO-binding membrane sensor protein with MHYT domain/nitrogen-specific signal transduction histidine kinase